MKSQKTGFEITHLFQILNSPRWLAMMFLLPLLVMVHFALAAPVAAPIPAAQSVVQAPAVEKFEHAKIGFNLSGAHAASRCTACHINNVFKGTPRDCAACHMAGNHMSATAKPTGHIATNVQCDVCHKTTLWIPAFFSHVGVVAGTCETCHNGTTTKGKSDSPTPHITTSLPCSECHHSTVSFKGASSALPSNHLPTTQLCTLCHAIGTGVGSGVMDHLGITSNCNSCHNGQTFAVGMTPKRKQDASITHVTTTLDCSSCHFSTVTFTGAVITTLPVGHFPTTQACTLCHVSGYGTGSGVMSHQGISNNCISCHNGQMFVGGMKPVSKPTSHVPTTAVTNGAACETCHSISVFSSFAGTAMNHTGISTGCASCHNGQTFAVGVKPMSKPVGPPAHIPTTATCESCHAAGQTNVGGFAGTPMNHTGISNNCASCHNDGMSWAGVTIKRKQDDPTPPHMTTALDCSSCHSSTITFVGGAPTALPAGHLVTTQPCSLCHGVQYGAGSGVMNHLGISTGCASCHNGQTFAVGMKPVSKPTSHVPTTAVTNGAACETCHAANKTNVGGFSGTAMVHTGITTGCANCHNGQTFAVGVKPMSKPVGPPAHLPTTATCETCHATGQTSVGGFAGTTMKHTGITNNCASCHNDGMSWAGVTIKRKQDMIGGHVGTTLDCSSCHNSTITFAGAVGVLPAGHLVTTQPCSLCHAGYGAGSGVMKHVGIVSGCANCHNGQTFAVGMKPVSKPTNHVPTTAVTNGASCETCHSISVFSSFAGTAMKHTGIATGCINCHNGQIFAGVTPMNKSNYPGHVATALDCTSCHSSSNFTTFFPGVGGAMPTNHIVTAQPCTLCHAAGYSLTLTKMNHLGITTGCATCHNGQTFVGPQTPMVRSSKHIPYATMLLGGSGMQCEFCHKNTTVTGGFLTSTTGAALHNGSTGKGAGQCTGCHLSGTTYTGGMERKSLTHDSPGHTDCSDSGCHKPLGNKGTSYINWN